MQKKFTDKNINKTLFSLFSSFDDNVIAGGNAERYDAKQDKIVSKKRNIEISDIIKAAFLLKKHKTHISKTNKSLYSEEPSIDTSFRDVQNDSNTITPEYIRYLVKKTKPYRRFRPFDDPVSYTKTIKNTYTGSPKNTNSFSTILNHLNLDDDEITNELYKYNKATLPYKNFEYPKSARKLCFTGLAKKLRQIYIYEALNTMPTVAQDMRHQYAKNPFVYIKRYFENSLSYKDIQQNNLQQIFFAIFLVNSRDKTNLAIDYDEWIERNLESKQLRKNDRELYFFRTKKKLLNKKKTLLFEKAKQYLYSTRLRRLSFVYTNVSKLTDKEIIEMVKLLCSYDAKKKTFPFLNEPHKIFKNAKTDFEIGKALLAYLRDKIVKKKKKKLCKKAGFNKYHIRVLKKIKTPFSLKEFFSQDSTTFLRQKSKAKSLKNVDFHLAKLDQQADQCLYKSFDRIFLPMIINHKFKNINKK